MFNSLFGQISVNVLQEKIFPSVKRLSLIVNESNEMARYVDEDATGGVWRLLLDDYFDGLYNLLYTKQWNVSNYELSSSNTLFFFSFFFFFFCNSVLFQQLRSVPACARCSDVAQTYSSEPKFAKQNRRNVIIL